MLDYDSLCSECYNLHLQQIQEPGNWEKPLKKKTEGFDGEEYAQPDNQEDYATIDTEPI